MKHSFLPYLSNSQNGDIAVINFPDYCKSKTLSQELKFHKTRFYFYLSNLFYYVELCNTLKQDYWAGLRTSWYRSPVPPRVSFC